jgi:hypothetical protein
MDDFLDMLPAFTVCLRVMGSFLGQVMKVNEFLPTRVPTFELSIYRAILRCERCSFDVMRSKGVTVCRILWSSTPCASLILSIWLFAIASRFLDELKTPRDTPRTCPMGIQATNGSSALQACNSTVQARAFQDKGLGSTTCTAERRMCRTGTPFKQRVDRTGSVSSSM